MEPIKPKGYNVRPFTRVAWLLAGLLVLRLGIDLLFGPNLFGLNNASAIPQTESHPASILPKFTPTPANKIQTVFVIPMENTNWADIQNSPSAPYINQTLLPRSSYALQYFNPPNLHPSEPNYLWLESGTSFGIKDDGTPIQDNQNTTDHLVAYLDKVGLSWKVYAEGISGKDCPVNDHDLFASRHIPMLFFNDVTNKNDPRSANCIAHIRPMSELKQDLQSGKVANYNFIVPDTCNDMHDSTGCKTNDTTKNGDTWLSQHVGQILDAAVFKRSGALFITWDESIKGDHPIGMMVLSPFAKGNGYSNSIHYTHSSMLRTLQEIFNLQPWLGDAAKSNDLSDLFAVFP